MTGVEALRNVRRFQVAAIVLNVCTLMLNLALGHLVGALIPVACIAALSVAVHVQTGLIRRREAADRPRPDYALIARMEREVWGRAFEHDGAPDATIAELHATMDDLAERATARLPERRGCGCREAWVAGMCTACYKRLRWERWS